MILTYVFSIHLHIYLYIHKAIISDRASIHKRSPGFADDLTECGVNGVQKDVEGEKGAFRLPHKTTPRGGHQLQATCLVLSQQQNIYRQFSIFLYFFIIFLFNINKNYNMILQYFFIILNQIGNFF